MKASVRSLLPRSTRSWWRAGRSELDEKTLREGLESELGLVGGSQKEEWYDTWEEEEPKVIAEVEAQRLQEEEEEEEEEE